jgi:transposase
MKRIPKQQYTAASKEQAVAMVKGGKAVPEVARALGLSEQALRNWVKADVQGELHEGTKEVTPEQAE